MVVLIAVQERQIAISDSLNPNPISGRQAIFAKVSTQTTTGYQIDIVGIYSDLDSAANARANHARAHPNRRYIQKVAQLNEGLVLAETNRCIRCHIEIGAVGSYCPACQQQYFEEARNADPLAGAPEAVPLIPASVGPQTVFVNGRT